MANSVQKEKQKKIIELERIYVYPNEFHPSEVMLNVFKDITKIDIQADGSHRIRTADGNTHYVSNQYIRIKALPADDAA